VGDVEKDPLSRLIGDAWRSLPEEGASLSHWAKDLKMKARLNFEILFSFLKTMEVRRVLGINFDNITLKEAVEKIESLIRSKTPHLVVTPNPEIVVAARRDKDLRDKINNASLRLADGVGIIWASKVLRRPIKEKITGIDISCALLSVCEKKGYRVFLLGSKPGVAEGAAEYLIKAHSKLKIVGTYHGYFSPEEEGKTIENIKSLNPDLILIGLGSPKQEKWAAENLSRFGNAVCLAVGGSLDVLAGRVKRAPLWMRGAGLEWLYRLLREPWRFRRQISLLKFVFLVIFTRLFLRTGRK